MQQITLGFRRRGGAFEQIVRLEDEQQLNRATQINSKRTTLHSQNFLCCQVVLNVVPDRLNKEHL